jgi:hypothetical protein
MSELMQELAMPEQSVARAGAGSMNAARPTIAAARRRMRTDVITLFPSRRARR